METNSFRCQPTDCTRVVISRLTAAFILALASFPLLLTPAFGDSISDILNKSARAAQTVSYKGTFMYALGQQADSMRVFHRITSKGFKTRILSLNGDESEIVRSEKGVWCYFPKKKEGFFKSRDAHFFRIPMISAESMPELRKYYTVMLEERERIAGRWAHQLEFLPKDSYRYGLKIWVDEESGLVLRSDMLSRDMKVIDRYMFVDIATTDDIPDSDLMPSAPGDDYIWTFSMDNDLSATEEMTPLVINMIPDGFKKISHVRSDFKFEEKEQIVYSDELATVSLFVQKLPKDNTEGHFFGASQLGSVNAYGRVIDGYQVTVLGEVPGETVRAIGDSIELKRSGNW